MVEFAEPRVRTLVAEQLGVDFDELSMDVSLPDNLAADSLDLLELAIVLEDEFGIELSESTIDSVRTYGDLVAAVRTQVRQRPNPEVQDPPPVHVLARVFPARPRGSGEVHRAGCLTPYTLEAIAEDALYGGRGSRLELTVPWDLPEASVTDIGRRFAWLAERGVQVQIRRDLQVGPLRLHASPHAAA
jgi:acyl carrier protein